MTSPAIKRWITVAGFAMLAVAAGYRSLRALTGLAADHDARGWLSLVYCVCVLVVLVTVTGVAVRRPPARRETDSAVAYVATAVAVGGLVFVTPPGGSVGTGQVVLGDAVAVAAGVWMAVSVAVLGRCFGLLPEARGLVVRGPYRIVRHPIYLGEITAIAGLTLAAPGVRNGMVLGVFVAAQAVRMRLEEQALRAEFPEYAVYAERTRRLIPRLRLFDHKTRAYPKRV